MLIFLIMEAYHKWRRKTQNDWHSVLLDKASVETSDFKGYTSPIAHGNCGEGQ